MIVRGSIYRAILLEFQGAQARLPFGCRGCRAARPAAQALQEQVLGLANIDY